MLSSHVMLLLVDENQGRMGFDVTLIDIVFAFDDKITNDVFLDIMCNPAYAHNLSVFHPTVME